MNKRMVLHTTGHLLIAEGLLLLLPTIVAFYYGEASKAAFLISAGICIAAGVLLRLIKPRTKAIYAREGFVIVSLSWVLLSALGALPFVLSGDIPNYIDAFFETVSGFTTTGSSILRDVEACGKAVLFWRSFTHWVGGMGVLVFVMVILPLGGERSIHLVRAEVPGPTAGKLVPKMRDTARILYTIYLGLTLLQIVLLCIGGMGLFDSMVTTFGTAGTGGFANYNNSIAHFTSPYIQYVIGVFMLLFGINFNLYYLILIKRCRSVYRNEELRTYLIIVAAAVLLITINIASSYESVSEAIRMSFFQVASIITTTGYSTTNFDLWPQFSKTILVLLMFIGACASSTGGGIKVSRIILLFRTVKHGISRMLHPRAINSVHLEGRAVSAQVIHETSVYIICYAFLFAISVLLVSIDGEDAETTFTSVAACINNVGPGLSKVGPAGNFADFSVFSKLVLSFDMLVGRLEIFPMLILFAPSVWKLNRR